MARFSPAPPFSPERQCAMKKVFGLFGLIFSFYAYSGPCDYPDQRDSAGRRCGGRAASVRPGGRLGGDGNYQDSYGRQRVYGRDNDPYDSDYSPGGLDNDSNEKKQTPFSF